MALQTRGFDVTNIPRAEELEFNLQPGQYTAGMNSGIGAFNAFNNIAEEVRDRPLKDRERKSRLAQIEAEAQTAPLRRQLAEIQLTKAGMPEDIVTNTTAIRVPRTPNLGNNYDDGSYDIVEQIEGVTFDPQSGTTTPFKRPGKLLTSAEKISSDFATREKLMRDEKYARNKAAQDAAYRSERQRLTELQIAAQEKANDSKAKPRIVLREGEDENGNKVIIRTNLDTGEVTTESLEGVKPIKYSGAGGFNPWGAGPKTGSGTGIATGNPPKPEQPQGDVEKAIALAALDEFANGQPEVVPAVTPVIPVTPLSTTSGKYKIIQR